MRTDDESISAEEKIKQLIEQEEERRKELEKKKKEIEEKQKELSELEKQRASETENTRKEIEEKIEELAVEEKERYAELEEIRRKREEEAASLEETIAGEEREGRIREVPRQRGYGEIFEEILQGRPGLYDITNYNILNTLESIASEAETRPLTEKERDFIEIMDYHVKKLQESGYQDQGNYLAREQAQIDNIRKVSRDANIMKGEYNP